MNFGTALAFTLDIDERERILKMIKEIKDGILYFDGCSTKGLAEKYGTPLYVISETDILEKISQLKADFTDKYDGARIAYACKAFCTKAMIKLCEREGLFVDVVSGGELYTAVSAGFPPEKIEFNGNNKLPAELEEAIDYGIGRIIIDGLGELELIESICKEKGKKVKVLYRITPGIKVDSHDYMITGKKDSKFGIPLDEDIFYPEIEKAVKSQYVEFYGIHIHLGSQVFENKPYIQALEIVLNYVKEIKRRYGCDVKELNFGGGFGATYIDEERKPFSYFLEPMLERVREFCEEEKRPLPYLVVEPGRSLMAEAGITLHTIGRIKDVRGVRKYVSIDGGMCDNIRPALYQAKYKGVVANKADLPEDDKVTVCGKCCESGDILFKDCMVTSKIETGDLFATFSTGAYGYSMAFNYNRNPIPAVVLVKEGRSEVIVKRQTYENMVSNDLIPESLK